MSLWLFGSSIHLIHPCRSNGSTPCLTWYALSRSISITQLTVLDIILPSSNPGDSGRYNSPTWQVLSDQRGGSTFTKEKGHDVTTDFSCPLLFSLFCLFDLCFKHGSRMNCLSSVRKQRIIGRLASCGDGNANCVKQCHP